MNIGRHCSMHLRVAHRSDQSNRQCGRALRTTFVRYQTESAGPVVQAVGILAPRLLIDPHDHEVRPPGEAIEP
jgi:hypothetical protein